MLPASEFAAIGFGFVAQNPPWILVATALLSAGGYAIDTAASAARLGPISPAAVAALVVAGIGVCAPWLERPASAFATCAVLPLLPEFMLYQALLCASNAALDASNPLIAALGTALALAGVTFGEYLAILVWRPISCGRQPSNLV
jgi:uncharacterized membrane protein YjjB (DUF3815 family)